MATLSINSDNVVELRNLKNTITGEAITTATVTITIVEKITETEVTGTGVTWPLTLPHIANGLYQGTIKNEAELDTRLSYVGTMVADNGADQHKEWCIQYTAACG